VLYNANGRTIPLEWSEKLGGAWAPGTRSARIAELLAAKERFSEKDLLEIQLDTRVKVYDSYQKLFLLLTEESASTDVIRARQIVEDWNGKADADQAGMRILQAFRSNLHEAILAPLLKPCLDNDPAFRFEWELVEESVSRLLEERPLHFLPSAYESWESFLGEVLDETVKNLKETHPDGLFAPWGDQNRVVMNHPLARLAPELSGLLNFPNVPIPGHMDAIRVSNPGYGASLRMVISPGHPVDAIFEMPGGPSGNPWSPHYRSGQRDWIAGNPTSFYSHEMQTEFSLIPNVENN
jgi:penicillin amidase